MTLFSHVASYSTTLAQTPTPDEIRNIGLPEAPEPELEEPFMGTVKDGNGTPLTAIVTINGEHV